MSTERELPKYRRHKQVCALKIAAIEIAQDGSAKIASADEGFGTLTVGPEYAGRFKGDDQDMGYYVQYQDGYESWSPSAAFESGYTKLAADETPGISEQELYTEERLRWRMDLIVRYADSRGRNLEDAAKDFLKAQAILTKTEE